MTSSLSAYWVSLFSFSMTVLYPLPTAASDLLSCVPKGTEAVHCTPHPPSWLRVTLRLLHQLPQCPFLPCCSASSVTIVLFLTGRSPEVRWCRSRAFQPLPFPLLPVEQLWPPPLSATLTRQAPPSCSVHAGSPPPCTQPPPPPRASAAAGHKVRGPLLPSTACFAKLWAFCHISFLLPCLGSSLSRCTFLF